MASISGRSPLEIIKEAVRARNRRLIHDVITPFYVFRTETAAGAGVLKVLSQRVKSPGMGFA
jgi:hypothetical protein